MPEPAADDASENGGDRLPCRGTGRRTPHFTVAFPGAAGPEGKLMNDGDDNVALADDPTSGHLREHYSECTEDEKNSWDLPPQTWDALLRAGRDLSRTVARGEETGTLILQATAMLREAGGYDSVRFVPAGEGHREKSDSAALSFPVEVNGHRHGLLVVVPASGRRTADGERRLLEDCADDLALAFHHEHLERARQKTLLRLIESEERFRQVFHQTNDAILLYEVDPAGHAHVCLEANDQACRWFGYSREELRQRSPDDLIRSPSASGPPPWNRSEPGPFLFDAVIRRRDERTTTAAISLHRFNLLGRPVMLLVARDVTEERRLETEQATSLEQIQQNMEQFQILNDQIRNPVQVIIGLADLEGGEFSRQIIRQAREIDQIVRQLDVGWLESAKVSSYLRRYDT